MNTKRLYIPAVAAFLAASLTLAQEVLPKPEEAFKDAKIGPTYKDSKPGTMTLTKAPAGAPNVLIILIDDSGFGQWGTFGGQVPTPNLDRLARMGLFRGVMTNACGQRTLGYDPKRDPVTHVLEGRKGQPVHERQQLTLDVRRDIDVEYMNRAKSFLKRSTDSGKHSFYTSTTQ